MSTYLQSTDRFFDSTPSVEVSAKPLTFGVFFFSPELRMAGGWVVSLVSMIFLAWTGMPAYQDVYSNFAERIILNATKKSRHVSSK